MSIDIHVTNVHILGQTSLSLVSYRLNVLVGMGLKLRGHIMHPYRDHGPGLPRMSYFHQQNFSDPTSLIFDSIKNLLLRCIGWENQVLMETLTSYIIHKLLKSNYEKDNPGY